MIWMTYKKERIGSICNYYNAQFMMEEQTMNNPIESAHITASMPLPPAINAWKYFLEDQNRSIHTIKAFGADVSLLADYLAPEKPVGGITTDDLNQYVHWLEKGRAIPCSPKSLSRRITSIKSFFGWLHKNGVVDLNPAEKVLQQSVISPLPEVLCSEEVDLLYEACNQFRVAIRKDARPYSLYGLLVETGIKKGECLAIDLNHLDFPKQGPATLFIRYANPAYRFKERKIELSEKWVEAYQEYAAQYRLKDKLFPWSPRRLEYILEDLGEAAGLLKHLSFDMCRWTSVLIDYKNGEDVDKIRQKLGISKIQYREISMKLKELATKTD
jgi:site-specific recombinase XerD